MPTGSISANTWIVGGRQRHHRTRDHYGTEEDTTVVLSAPIGGYAAGTTVADVLADMFSRLVSLEDSNHRVASFTVDAFVQPSLRADAVIYKALPKTFVANAVLTAGGRLLLDATLLRTQPSSVTANAVIV